MLVITQEVYCIIHSAAIDLSNYLDAQLSFWRFVDDGLDSGEYLKVEISNDNGTNWNQVFYWTDGSGDDNLWHQESLQLDTSYLTDNFVIQFNASASLSSEEVEVDDVLVSGTKPFVIFSEPFDNFDEWIEQGELDWRTGTPDEGGHPPGVNATTNTVAEADNCDTECKLVLKNGLDLTGLSSANMTLYRYVDNSLDTGEYLKVDISSDNGTNWTNIFSWLGGVDDDDTWHLEEYDLDSYLNNDTVKLRALAKASSSFEEVMIDELKISGILNVSGNGTGGNSTNFIALTDYSVYLADTDDK